MSAGTGTEDVAQSSVAFRLLNDFQRDFPLVPRPFEPVARALGIAEAQVISAYRRLQAQGALSRIGAVFAPGRVGASTLAALAVAPAALESVAGLVSAHPGVNHNYAREHRYNLWFVATAPDAAALAELLARIGRETGCAPLVLPLEQEYHIDLGFDLAGAHGPRRERPGCPVRSELPECAPRVIAALQDGLDLVPRPYTRLAMKAGLGESMVLELLAGWLSQGILRRFGVVVRHRELGYTANAMAVWDVPDEAVAALGGRLAREPGVSLCYRRRRARPEWPYNLFCMIHGREREEVTGRIRALERDLGLAAFPGAVLFSTRRFKQCGPRYAHG